MNKKIVVKNREVISFFFGTSLIYQFFHFFEHLFILYQHWWLGISRLGAHGFLFFLDFEWTHFVLNFSYFVAIFFIFWASGFYKRSFFNKSRKLFLLVATATFFQGYHSLEHLVRIFQHYQRNCEPCPGILRSFFTFDDIYLHIFFNSIAFILPLLVFFLAGFFRSFLQSLGLTKKE